MEKKIPKRLMNSGVEQRCALIFSFGRGRAHGRNGPAQELDEFFGVGGQVARKERPRNAAQTQSLGSIQGRSLG